MVSHHPPGRQCLRPNRTGDRVNAPIGLDLCAQTATRTTLPLEFSLEHAALVLEGSVSIEGEALEPGTLLNSVPDGRQVLIVSGIPFEEEVLPWWHCVAREPEEIEAALADWHAGRHFAREIRSPTKALQAPALSAKPIPSNHSRKG